MNKATSDCILSQNTFSMFFQIRLGLCSVRSLFFLCNTLSISQQIELKRNELSFMILEQFLCKDEIFYTWNDYSFAKDQSGVTMRSA